jgi:hypothetical protein
VLETGRRFSSFASCSPPIILSNTEVLLVFQKVIFKIIQDYYFDITLIINGSFYFQDMESHQPNRHVTPFIGILSTAKKSTDISKLIVHVCIDNKLINQKIQMINLRP